MRIAFASDLHLEFPGAQVDTPDVDDVDLVLLAGDVGNGLDGISWAARIAAPAVVYVPGNHEYYGHNRPELLGRLRSAAAALDHVHLLDNDVLDLPVDGRFWRVLGATLWTDFAVALGNPRHPPGLLPLAKGPETGEAGDGGTQQADGQQAAANPKLKPIHVRTTLFLPAPDRRGGRIGRIP